MGKTITPAYRVEFRGYGRTCLSPEAWDYSRLGRPNDKKLADFVGKLEDSTRPGGINEHIGYTPIASAYIIRQSSGDVVAQYHGPSFVAF